MTEARHPTGAPSPGIHMESELASQPDMWARAADLRADQSRLPARGERIAVVGCGTSWFMAQCYAALRESAGHGATDAFAASEAFVDRDYDAIVAITRSGTTTELIDLVDGVRGTTRTIALVGDPGAPIVDLVDDVIALPFADEVAVVQTRFATTALALLRASLGENLDAVIVDAAYALSADLDELLLSADQYTFLGTGWTVGIAHEAALTVREASQSWAESYPAREYRHGPISIAAPGRVTWTFGAVPDGLYDEVAATGAHFEHRAIDGMADLIRAQRVALERGRSFGLDPDAPRNLTRSVILDS